MNKNETLFNEMEQAYTECGEHCRRVADLVLAFCNFLNIDKDTTGDIHTAALGWTWLCISAEGERNPLWVAHYSDL